MNPSRVPTKGEGLSVFAVMRVPRGQRNATIIDMGSLAGPRCTIIAEGDELVWRAHGVGGEPAHVAVPISDRLEVYKFFLLYSNAWRIAAGKNSDWPPYKDAGGDFPWEPLATRVMGLDLKGEHPAKFSLRQLSIFGAMDHNRAQMRAEEMMKIFGVEGG